MRKLLLIAAFLMLALALLTACGQTDEPPTVITIWFMGGTVQEDADVEEAANARLRELDINIDVNFVWTGGWDMGTHAVQALYDGDTSIDIFWTGSWGLNFFTNARLGNFIRLDAPDNNLLEAYGRDVMAALPQVLWDAFTLDGPQGMGLYAIPGYKDYTQMFVFDVNNTRLAELGFDFYELFDMDGYNYNLIFTDKFEEALHAAKDMYGLDFFPLGVDASWARIFSHLDGDPTGMELFHFPFDPYNPSGPRNILPTISVETELYVQVLERLHHFWNQGFIDPRSAIPSVARSNWAEQQAAGEYLFSATIYAYGHTRDASASRGIDARFPPISSPLISTNSAAGSGFAISAHSENPEKALQFLNAWYTDHELATILAEGVEGTHHLRNDDGTITRLPGGRDVYAPWRFGMGNVFALPPLEADGPDFLDRFRAYNQLGIPTNFLGFSFDNRNVADKIPALIAVRDEFMLMLASGSVNPAEIIPQYLDALRANGLDTVYAELIRQVEEFYANR